MRTFILKAVGYSISIGTAYALGVEGWWLLAWSFTHGAISSTCGWPKLWAVVADICSNIPWWIFLIDFDAS